MVAVERPEADPVAMLGLAVLAVVPAREVLAVVPAREVLGLMDPWIRGSVMGAWS
jgi:hypothetical protein